MNDVPPPPPPPYGSVPPGFESPQVGTALSYGFNKYFANVGPVLAVIVVYVVVQVVFVLIGLSVTSLAGNLLLNVVGFVVSAVVSLGIYKTALLITAGQVPTLGEAFTYDRWGEWIVFSIVYGLMVGIGLALCLIPGLFV